MRLHWIWQNSRAEFLTRILAGVCLTGLLGGAAMAQEPPPDIDTIVQESAAAYVDAYNAADAEKLAALYAEQAETVTAQGEVLTGRDAIREEYTAQFAANPGLTMALDVLSVRQISPGLIVEDGVAAISAEGDEEPQTVVRYVATHARQADGKWLLASVRDLATAPLTPRLALKPLSWLVGDWLDETDGIRLRTTWAFDENHTFLIGRYSLQQGQQAVVTGVHRIGWDAQKKQFRHWMFDAEGGFAEGLSHFDSNGNWVIQFSAVAAEGASGQSTLTYERDGADAAIVTQTGRWLGGESLPARAARVVRRPPNPGIE